MFVIYNKYRLHCHYGVWVKVIFQNLFLWPYREVTEAPGVKGLNSFEKQFQNVSLRVEITNTVPTQNSTYISI